MLAPNCHITSDTLFDGRLICRQHRDGYRFSIDSVLVAHFCRIRNFRHVLDLGTGCGIIGLILAYRYALLHVTCLEIQGDLAQLARTNAQLNHFSERMTIIHGDIRQINRYVKAESYDLVVSNPPYQPVGRGRMNPLPEQARARHEIDANLTEVIKACAFAVKNRGEVVVVYPARRMITLVHGLHRFNLMPKRMQLVYSYPGENNACLVLVEAVKNGGEELAILPPLYIYAEKNGTYSDRVQKFYE